MTRPTDPEGHVVVRDRAPTEDDDTAALQEAIAAAAYTGVPVFIYRPLVVALPPGQRVVLKVPYAQ